MKTAINIIIGLVGVFVGVGLFLPALAKMLDQSAVPGGVIGLYTIGVVLALAGCGTAVLAIARRKV